MVNRPEREDKMPVLTADDVKRLAIVGLASVRGLTERLVLKGGNLLDLVYDVAPRSSVDLDFSMPDEFTTEELQSLEEMVEAGLQQVFAEEGHIVFDVTVTERPSIVSVQMKAFWGGYRIEFKLIDLDLYEEHAGDPQRLRVSAMDLGPGHRKAFRIEISKFEHCTEKSPRDFQGSTVYVYTPAMMVLEKLRAICQQMPEYRDLVRSHPGSPRARDFVDIHAVMDHFPGVDLASSENRLLLRQIFKAKRVPLELIGRVANFREYHREGFASVVDTVRPGITLQGFDFYFDYVIEHCCEPLHPAGEE